MTFNNSQHVIRIVYCLLVTSLKKYSLSIVIGKRPIGFYILDFNLSNF